MNLRRGPLARFHLSKGYSLTNDGVMPLGYPVVPLPQAMGSKQTKKVEEIWPEPQAEQSLILIFYNTLNDIKGLEKFGLIFWRTRSIRPMRIR